MVDEAAAKDRPPIVQGLLQSIAREASMLRARSAPADDLEGACIDHEGDVDEFGPGRDIGEVGQPQNIRPGRLRLSVDMIERTRRDLSLIVVLIYLPRITPLQAYLPHQSSDRAVGDVEAPRLRCRQTLRTP